MYSDYGLISVIVPVYNVEQYLSRCVDSLLAQTYHNLEIILVDDGSTDNSGAICDLYSKKDKRISVIHKKNGGLSDARNVGIDLANGSYIGFVDSDDWIAQNMLETLLHNMIYYEADVSICRFKFTADEKEKEVAVQNETRIYDKYQAIDAMFIDKVFASHACNKLYKAHLFDNIRFPIGKIYEDQFTTYKIIWAANKIVYTNKQCYYYFIRNDSIARGNFDAKQFDVLDATDVIIDFFKERYPEIVKYVQYCWIDNYLYLLMNAIRQECDISGFKMRNKVWQYNKGYILSRNTDVRMKCALLLVCININWFRVIFKIINKIKQRLKIIRKKG